MRKFLRVVALANGRQLLDHDGRQGQSFWVSRARRLAVRPGRGRAANGHTLSFLPLAEYCPQFIDEIDKQGSEVLIPSEVTQQVVLGAGVCVTLTRLSRPALSLIPGCSLRLAEASHRSRDASGGGMADFSRGTPPRVRAELHAGTRAGRSLLLRTAAASWVLSLLHKGHPPETSFTSEALGTQGGVVSPR